MVTPPLTDGAVESVERRSVMEVVGGRELRLTVVEESIVHSELTGYDELFFVDASGLTSLSECDGAKFTALVAPKIAQLMTISF